MDKPAFDFEYFVSRRGSVADVAQEVADILEGEGHAVTIQDYDFPAGAQFVGNIDDALRRSRHLLILYSADYHDSYWTRQEFLNFKAAVAVSDGQRRIGVLRCDPATPTGLLHADTFGDLNGVTDPAERRRIVLAVAHGETPAARPEPRIFGGGMPLENRLFTGRLDAIAALHGTLSSGGIAAVRGIGGIGKTSLARRYIAEHGGDYAGVWWIAASDEAKLVAGLDGLARALHPALPADAKPDDNAQLALKTIAGRRGGRFLLVFDNAESPALVARFVPERGAAILATSRTSGWEAMAMPLPLTALPAAQAAKFLIRRAGRTDPAGAAALAQALGYLPLALDHAGAYIQMVAIGFAAYAGRIDELLAVVPPAGADYPSSVAATFALAIDAIPLAEPVLGLFAWLDPDAIPRSLAEAVEPDARHRDAAIAALTGASLVTPVEDTACGPSLSVHRLVQMTMRARLAARGEAAASRDRALGALAAAFPYAFNDPVLWPACRVLMPHVRAIDAHVGDTLSADLGALLNRAGSFLHGSGAASDGVPQFRRALEARERVLGPEHPDTLTSRHNLAFCLQAMGDRAAAEPLYRRVLAGR